MMYSEGPRAGTSTSWPMHTSDTLGTACGSVVVCERVWGRFECDGLCAGTSTSWPMHTSDTLILPGGEGGLINAKCELGN